MHPTSTLNEHNDKKLPNWKLPEDALTGYTGNLRKVTLQDHVLETVHRRRMIRGYSGFVPNGKTISGKPIIPSDERQKILNDISLGTTHSGATMALFSEEEPTNDFESFREYAKHMDLLERYADSTRQLLERGQSPEMLIKLVQAKISERVQSYSQQLITVKLEFQQYGIKTEDGLTEVSLRECLERMNIQV
jgi:hypothetical protein